MVQENEEASVNTRDSAVVGWTVTLTGTSVPRGMCRLKNIQQTDL